MALRGIALEWFKDDLGNCYQFVSLNGVESHKLPVTFRVPRGQHWVLYYSFSSYMI